MALKKNSHYQQLLEKSKSIQIYNSILQLLHWDQETFMPSGAIGPRSEQISLLSELIHEEKRSRGFKALLTKLISFKTGAIKAKGLSLPQKVIVREWLKDYDRAAKLPSQFVKNFAQVTSEASQIWAIAKQQNNFKLFAPFLEKIIDLNRKKAEMYGYSDHPYDALLEAYEPCATSTRVAHLFEPLQKELTQLREKITESRKIDNRFLHRKVDPLLQQEIGHLFANKMPVDPGYTRLDLSSHPFSMALHPKDSRITSRIIPTHFMSNIFSVLHEAGHSMYEMGLPTETWGTPLSESVSLSVHESQSRWWETLIGRSFPFWKHMYPALQKKVPNLLQKVPLERFYRAINTVTPSFIRVEADEVTYCLHVILRFSIEKELIAGKLSVLDLPEAWNAKFKELFGLTPPNHAQGCLQDIHWSLGDFGYFPTYALGNLLAAQFFQAFEKKHPDWATRLAHGDLAFIREWLKIHIHQHGRRYTMDELVKRVSGKPLSHQPYCRYLKEKYAEIYRFE